MNASTDTLTRPQAWSILIVDDHPAIREALTLRLSQEPDLKVCASVSNAANALAAIDQYQPDMAVLDLTLPDSQGLELLKEVHARHPDVRILVFSMHDENLYGERALRSGAQGYLMKHESPDKVHRAIRRVLEGKMALSDELSQKLLNNIRGKHSATLTDIERLSDRELDVFRMVGQGLSTKDIAHRLSRGVKTIETHRLRIKEKLGIGSAAELVAKAAAWVAESK